METLLIKHGQPIELPGKSADDFHTTRVTQQSVRAALGDISSPEQKKLFARIAFLAMFKEEV